MQNTNSTNNTDRAAIAARLDAITADFCQIYLDAHDRDLTPEESAEAAALQTEIGELNARLSAMDAPAQEPAAEGDAEEDDEKPEEEEEPAEEEPEAEGFNTPTVYLDGTALTYRSLPEPELLERVEVEFDDAANGTQTAADERAALGWVNSAAIELNRGDDSVTLSISVGDPRGAFTLVVRRCDDGSLVMHVPHPGESLLHRPLRRLHEGTYAIG